MTRALWALGFLLSLAAGQPFLSAAEPKRRGDSDEPLGGTATATVKSALEAEAAGDNGRRNELLAAALADAPDLPLANWHLARVNVLGGWVPTEDAVAAAAADPNVTTYLELRDKLSSYQEMLALARWCKKHGYSDRGNLHYAQVLAHPRAAADAKAEAVKALDLQPFGNSWLTRAEVAARAAEARQLEAAVTQWGPRLKKLQAAIDGDDYKRRDLAITELHKIDDPSVIAPLSLFVGAGDRFQEEAIKRLASFEHYEATMAIVRYALDSEVRIVRSQAASALRDRPFHEYVPLLVGRLVAPIKTRYRVQWNGQGIINYTHAFLQEGPTSNTLLLSQGIAAPVRVDTAVVNDQRVRAAPNQPVRENVKGSVIGVSAGQALGNQLLAAETQAAVAEAQVLQSNTLAAGHNDRVFAALEQATNEQLPPEPQQWWNWWQDYNHYQWIRPTTYVHQSSAHQYVYGQHSYIERTGTRPAGSCFVAGTPVHTDLGEKPVETLKPGDRVLAQDPDSGELAYKVILSTTVRPPTKTFRITVGDETIITTQGHPFWVNGHGWKMAKELAVGHVLHTLHGAVSIESIDAAPDAQAFNLVVDDFNTYFVGRHGLLVHDNNFRRSTRAVVPGLVRN